MAEKWVKIPVGDLNLHPKKYLGKRARQVHDGNIQFGHVGGILEYNRPGEFGAYRIRYNDGTRSSIFYGGYGWQNLKETSSYLSKLVEHEKKALGVGT